MKKKNSGFNIFLCGDLNFKLYSPNKLEIDNHLKTLSGVTRNMKTMPQIIKDYYIEKSIEIIKNSKSENKDKLFKQVNRKGNQLYQYIDEQIKLLYDKPMKGLLKEFQESMKTVGIHLTCKIAKENGRYFGNLINQCKGESHKGEYGRTGSGKFDCFPNEYPRIPSMCDRILFAVQNIRINKDDFSTVPLRISEHLPVILTGDFIDHSGGKSRASSKSSRN